MIQNWLREAPRFRVDGEKGQFVLSPAPNKVSEESHCWFRDSPLHRSVRPEKAGSHVSVQNNRRTSVTTTRLCSSSCIFSIMYAQSVVKLRFLTSHPFFGDCVFNVSGLANTENTRILGHKNSERDSKTWITEPKSNRLVSCAHQACERSILL